MATDNQELINALQSGRDLTLTEQAKLVEILQDKTAPQEGTLPASMVGDAHHAIRELQRLHETIFISVPDLNAGLQWGVKTQMNWLCAATNYTPDSK